MIVGSEERTALVDALTLFGALIAGAIGLGLFFASHDPAMAFHGLLFAVAASLAAIYILSTTFDHQRLPEPATAYMDGPIKVATIAAVFWGIAGFIVGDVHRLAAGLSRAQPRSAVDQLWPSAAAAHLGRDLRLRRQRAARHLVLRRAAHVPRAPCRPLGTLVRDLGLPALHRYCRHGLSARHHPGQGIRRARVVRRPLAHDRVGRLPARVPGHAGAAQGAAHLRRQLVLSGLHRHRRHAARRQQRDDPRQPDEPQELHRLLGRAGCDDAVVVRPQCGRLLPHRRLPRRSCTTSSPSAWSGRSIPTACPSCTSGR